MTQSSDRLDRHDRSNEHPEQTRSFITTQQLNQPASEAMPDRDVWDKRKGAKIL